MGKQARSYRMRRYPDMASVTVVEPHYRGGYHVSTLLEKAKNLRQRQTMAEQLLWRHVRRNALNGAKFRRQYQFGPYICDFYCHEALLVIECDGESHNTEEQHLKDQRRDAYFKNLGVTVLRFSNHEILDQTNEVLGAIVRQLVERRGRGWWLVREINAHVGQLVETCSNADFRWGFQDSCRSYPNTASRVPCIPCMHWLGNFRTFRYGL